MPFTIDPEVGAALAKLFTTRPPPAPVGDVQARRDRTGATFKFIESLQPTVLDCDVKDFHTKASDGHELLCRWIAKKGVELKDSPAVCYAHGGGMICLDIDSYDQIIKRYVTQSGVPFLIVEYRLAPEVQAPVPVTDVYAGLQYLHSHASELGVDPNRIAIMGDSAGGGIAASLAHYAKQQGGPAICKQILIYPMLDDRTTSASQELSPYLSWSVDDNKTGWQALLGESKAASDSGIPVVDAPGRMTVDDAKGLPPAYIDVGELDLFRDEDLEYAQVLGRAGISCEFHMVPGVPHAGELFAPEAAVARRIMEARRLAITSF